MSNNKFFYKKVSVMVWIRTYIESKSLLNSDNVKFLCWNFSVKVLRFFLKKKHFYHCENYWNSWQEICMYLRLLKKVSKKTKNMQKAGEIKIITKIRWISVHVFSIWNNLEGMWNI